MPLENMETLAAILLIIDRPHVVIVVLDNKPSFFLNPTEFFD
jgi:hypothetical protein